MASGGGIKGFYRERKKAGGVAKPSAAAAAHKAKVTGAVKAPSGAQPTRASFDADGSAEEEYGAEEAALRQFDMDMRYGPCIGISRLERWQRAARLGLRPPAELEGLLLSRLEAGAGGPVVNLECILDGRV